MLHIPRKSNVDEVRREEVVVVRSYFGDGVEANPGRTVTEVFTLDGELIARRDPFRDREPAEPEGDPK